MMTTGRPQCGCNSTHVHSERSSADVLTTWRLVRVIWWWNLHDPSSEVVLTAGHLSSSSSSGGCGGTSKRSGRQWSSGFEGDDWPPTSRTVQTRRSKFAAGSVISYRKSVLRYKKRKKANTRRSQRDHVIIIITILILVCCWRWKTCVSPMHWNHKRRALGNRLLRAALWRTDAA